MAVGTHKGYVQIWDAAAGKKLFTLEGHTARVGEHSVEIPCYRCSILVVHFIGLSLTIPMSDLPQVHWHGTQTSCHQVVETV